MDVISINNISNVIDFISETIKSTVDYFMNIWNKVSDFFKRVFESVKKYVDKISKTIIKFMVHNANPKYRHYYLHTKSKRIRKKYLRYIIRDFCNQ